MYQNGNVVFFLAYSPQIPYPLQMPIMPQQPIGPSGIPVGPSGVPIYGID
jgi:hypothetical protein